MNAGITTLTRVAIALSACLVFVATHHGAAARDRGYDGSGFVVRDHRMPPVVRDHRAPVIVRDRRAEPVIRDHRTIPVVRDHRMPRGPQGGVSVTSAGSRRGGSPCIRSVFGWPCFGL
ncbi:hypothetical protein [Microvirga tunisiensis]|uniref:hypothetical protein n=1 Tax=Microvirga tunisiensis TaxID=2108360 RepID=UPI0018657FB2|nr:hypothetical protein [Microvirga tunisiensis]